MHSLLPLMTWWPVVIDLLVLVPFLLATRALWLSWQARWLAALLFCVGNWVGQDYFSPQSFNYLLYLLFIAIVLTWFSGRRTVRAGARTPGERPARQLAAPQRAIMLVLLVLLFAVSALSHQLTPFLIAAACAGLVLVGRCSPRGLPVLLAVILAGWISYGTVAYWSGHASTIFGDIGQLGGNFSASVSSRVSGTSIHQVADKTRIGVAALMAGLAAAGLLRRWAGRISDRALIVLVLAPVTIAGVQSYGGEVALRVYLFALPALAVLAACLFFPGRSAGQRGRSERRARAIGVGIARRAAAAPGAAGAHGATAIEFPGAADRRRGRLRTGFALAAAGLLATGLAGLFLVARYGNEGFERTPPSEYAAMNYIYAHDQHGTAVLWLTWPANGGATPQSPWQFKDIARVNFVAGAAPRDPADLASVTRALRGLGRGAFLITTHTDAAYLNQTAGYPANWESRIRAALSADPGLRLAYAGQDAAVYQAKLPASAPAAHGPPISAAPARHTGWSPVGLGALAAAVLLLATRELIRECLPRRRWLLEPLGFACLPVLALLLVAIAGRFLALS